MSVRKTKPFMIILTFLVLMASGCSQRTTLDQSFEMPASGWYMNSGVEFQTEITDTLRNYDFSISIRNNIDYRYSNLYIFLITEFPNGNYARDTIEFVLADNYGQWLGKGWSDVKESNIILNENMRFPLSGDYKFIVQQAMREDTLEGIVSIGLKIVDSSN